MRKIKPITRGLYLAAIGVMAFSLIGFSNIVIGQNKGIGANEIIELTNKQRELLNAQPLAVNIDLMNAAQAKAENMAKEQYFSHNLPDGSAPWKFITDTGYSYLEAGENLAMTNQANDSVVNGWMNSPAHKDNVINKNFTDTGIGVAYFGAYQGYKNAYVVVAFYAKPGSDANIPVNVQPTYPAGEMEIVSNDKINQPYQTFLVVGLVILIGAVIIEISHLRTSHKRVRLAGKSK
ncbi:hypothetical protein KBC51_02330 [Candidatus Saccharibacteria bacterium]|nr:hypothetical protein [Candidatus Saccharibacteria bacterium]